MKYKIIEDVIWKVIDDETVILNPEKDEYYTLNNTGTAVWGLIDKGKDLEKLVGELLKQYNASENELKADVKKIIKDLLDKKLIKKS